MARDGSLPIHVTELELAAALAPVLRPLDTVVMEGGRSIAGVLGCLGDQYYALKPDARHQLTFLIIILLKIVVEHQVLDPLLLFLLGLLL